MKQSATTTRIWSTQGMWVDAAPVSRRTASAGGKSSTRLKFSLSRLRSGTWWISGGTDFAEHSQATLYDVARADPRFARSVRSWIT